MKEPTAKQAELLDYISSYQAENKVMPTLVEMANKLSISISGAQQRIDALMRKGHIERKNVYIIKSKIQK